MNNYNKKFTSILLIIFLSSNLSALTLKEGILEVIETSPIVKEKLKAFNEAQQDFRISRAAYGPSIDFSVRVGAAHMGLLKGDIKEGLLNHQTSIQTYTSYSNSLKLTQNLFDGFSTTHSVNYQEAKLLSTAYNYLDTANNVAFKMVEAYIDVIRAYQLYQATKEIVDINQKIYEDVRSLFRQGLTTKSEMTKIQATLSLSKSNLIVQKNNILNKEANVKNLLGRNIRVSDLVLPGLTYAMPESKERATLLAIQNNPTLAVNDYNIKGAQSIYRQRKAAFYPTLNLEVEQVFNDSYNFETKNSSSYETPDDRTKAYLVMNWNLYSGGAHSANLQKSRSSIHREVEQKRINKRQVIENIELAWTSYEVITEQLDELYKYYKYSEETLRNYKSEYELGRRTLLDLLAAQSDLSASKNQIINSQMDKLFSQYRILDSMGLLVSTIVDPSNYSKILRPVNRPLDYVEDTLPIKLDFNGDGLVDNLDICDNSPLGGDNITAYGCIKYEKDSDFDGVPDSIDKCPNTPFGSIVDANGCEVRKGPNAFGIKEDYLKSVTAYTKNSPTKSSLLGLYDYQYSPNPNYNIKSNSIDDIIMYGDFSVIKRFDFLPMGALFNFNGSSLDKIANEIKKYNNPNKFVIIIGNTSDVGSKEENYSRGAYFANQIRHELTQRGINQKILITQSRSNLDNSYIGAEKEHDKLNNGVYVTLYVPKYSSASQAAPNAIKTNKPNVAPKTKSAK